MSMIREKLEQITRDDIMRFVALYSVAAFLVLFLVCPLCILFAKAFQYKDGSFAGLRSSQNISPAMLWYTLFQIRFLLLLYLQSLPLHWHFCSPIHCHGKMYQ